MAPQWVRISEPKTHVSGSGAHVGLLSRHMARDGSSGEVPFGGELGKLVLVAACRTWLVMRPVIG